MKGRRLVALGNLLAAALLMLAVWLLLVWVASRPALKTLIDLTPQRINSVDPVTEALLAELRGKRTKVDFHLFFPPVQGRAETPAEVQSLAIRSRLCDLTRILLRRYQWLGGEGVAIHDHDFYGNAATTREAAQRFDYKAAEGEVLVVAVTQEGKEPRFRKLSLVTDLATIDLPGLQPGVGPAGRSAAPVLKDYRGEEAISSTLKSLLVQGTPIAYFVDGVSPDLDKQSAAGSSYSSFRAGLVQAGFEVRDFQLSATGTVPPDATLLIVLEPRSEFLDRDAEALFAYVKRGGRLFLNYSWAALPDWNPTGGRLGELLGYEVSSALVCHMIPDTSMRSGGRDYDGPGADKLQLQGNPLHPITRRLVQANRPIEVAGARAVRERERAPEGMRREALLWTGDKGWFAVPGRDGFDFRAPRVGLQSYTIGMSIEVDPEPAPAGGEPTRPGQVVVIGGVFCNNAGIRFSLGDLAFNICNWMAERRVLLDIRGSRYEAKHLQLQPQQIHRIWWLLEAWVPGTFLVLGCVVVWLRRRV